MRLNKNFLTGLESAAFIISTTLGAGIFALPFVVAKAGWLLSLLYIIFFSVILLFVHFLYWESLSKIREKDGLVGLIKIYLGRSFLAPGILSILGGIILTLVIYLILANTFIRFLFPLDGNSGAVIFWFITSILFIFRLKWFAAMEFIGGLVIIGLVAIFYGGASSVDMTLLPRADWSNWFLPFGVILFALAGWTAIEPVYELGQRTSWHRRPIIVLTIATIVVALVYCLFVLGIFGTTNNITTDTISGLSNWGVLMKSLLGIFGLFLIWTSYIPMGREAIRALERDLGESKSLSFALVIFSPLFLYLLGLNSFMGIIGLVGGIFLSLQYLFIVLVSMRALKLKGLKLFAAVLSGLVFLAGVIYEIYYFVLH